MPSHEARPLTIPPELDAEMTPAVRAFVEALLDRITRLEGGRKTPQNSSLPPSSVHPHAKPASTKRKSKKKRGGQPGHKKHERPLIPAEQCDAVQSLKPAECRRCGKKLSGSDPEPLRHQV
jgi:transposase